MAPETQTFHSLNATKHAQVFQGSVDFVGVMNQRVYNYTTNEKGIIVPIVMSAQTILQKS
jgi:hypothetical protein